MSRIFAASIARFSLGNKKKACIRIPPTCSQCRSYHQRTSWRHQWSSGIVLLLTTVLDRDRTSPRARGEANTIETWSSWRIRYCCRSIWSWFRKRQSTEQPRIQDSRFFFLASSMYLFFSLMNQRRRRNKKISPRQCDRVFWWSCFWGVWESFSELYYIVS